MWNNDAIPYVNVAFGDLPERLKTAGDEVSVPREILMRLLELYISCWDFDEDWYLATYPDIKDAVNQGLFSFGLGTFPDGRLLGGPLRAPTGR